MKQPMNLDQTGLEKIALGADELVTWLASESKFLEESERTPIPLKLTVVASTASFYGLVVLLDVVLPLGFCWDGAGGCSI